MLGLVALPVFVLDQLVKLYIVRHLQLFAQIDVVPHWLAITYTLNSGAAFSLFATLSPALRGLMLDGERKSVEPMAQRLPDGDQQSLQQFLTD